MAKSSLEKRLRWAEGKLKKWLARHGVELPLVNIIVDPSLEEETLATHRHLDTIVVRETSVPESVIAHELVHIAQRTLEQFRGFRLLYTLLAEGLAEWVTKQLYPQHEVKYPIGYRLIELLVETDKRVIDDLLRLNDLPLVPENVEAMLR